MYDSMIVDTEGGLIPTTIKLLREQVGCSAHFLDMKIIQDGIRGIQVQMYDKRDAMPSLQNYRKFPHIETKLAKRSLDSVLHSQLCRFAVRCTRIKFFEIAAAKLMTDMIDNHYPSRSLSNKLHNFVKTFFRKSPIHVPNSYMPSVRRKFWYNVEQAIRGRICKLDFE